MDDLVAALEGLRCAGVAREGAEWVFRFGGDFALRVAATWRVLSGGRIELAREDDGQKFGLPSPVDGVSKANALLRGRVVERVSVSASADLSLDFGHSCRFEVFNDSSGYEAWTLHGPAGRLAIGIGGGGVRHMSES